LDLDQISQCPRLSIHKLVSEWNSQKMFLSWLIHSLSLMIINSKWFIHENICSMIENFNVSKWWEHSWYFNAEQTQSMRYCIDKFNFRNSTLPFCCSTIPASFGENKQWKETEQNNEILRR
jgi:hypothetical protein